MRRGHCRKMQLIFNILRRQMSAQQAKRRRKLKLNIRVIVPSKEELFEESPSPLPLPQLQLQPLPQPVTIWLGPHKSAQLRRQIKWNPTERMETCPCNPWYTIYTSIQGPGTNQNSIPNATQSTPVLQTCNFRRRSTKLFDFGQVQLRLWHFAILYHCRLLNVNAISMAPPPKAPSSMAFHHLRPAADTLAYFAPAIPSLKS